MPKKNESTERCHFCGRPIKKTTPIFEGLGGLLICGDCVTTAYGHLREKKEEIVIPWTEKTFPTPVEIKDFLDHYVMGQERAKITISVAVYNHYKRILYKAIRSDDDEVELDKSNILLLGPTGTGKTLLAQTLAKFLAVPFCIADATVLTEAGYVGEDVDNIIVRLLQSADYNVARTRIGIIYIDELDKIGKKSGGNPNITRDVSGEGVQQALLKILEGTKAHVPPQGGRKHPEQKLVEVDTRDILFICGGAFNGLQEIIAHRINKKLIGFDAEIANAKKLPIGEILSRMSPEDLIEFGFIPELVGRLPVSVSLDELDRDTMKHILTEPKNALVKQYKKLLDMDGIPLEFTDSALDAIVDEAMTRKTGARALRSIFESVMTPIMFELPNAKDINRCVIDRDTIVKRAKPQIEKSRS
ncbi:ATP-dependent Clp protease ATP-binding subunit ClpX [bacterium]|nr:ATP-dependent Clp protease ATP-binding subunit ClpX [bacterium]